MVIKSGGSLKALTLVYSLMVLVSTGAKQEEREYRYIIMCINLTNMQKYDTIINNDINGNMSDAYSAIRKLTKIELIDFIEYVNGNYEAYPRFEIIKLIRTALNR